MGSFGFITSVRSGLPPAVPSAAMCGSLEVSVKAIGSSYTRQPVDCVSHRLADHIWDHSFSLDHNATVAELKEMISEIEPLFPVCAMRLSLMGTAVGFCPMDRVYDPHDDQATLAQCGVQSGDQLALGLAIAPLVQVGAL